MRMQNKDAQFTPKHKHTHYNSARYIILQWLTTALGWGNELTSSAKHI